MFSGGVHDRMAQNLDLLYLICTDFVQVLTKICKVVIATRAGMEKLSAGQYNTAYCAFSLVRKIMAVPSGEE